MMFETLTTPNAVSLFERTFRDALKKRLDEIVAEEIQKAQQRVSERVPEVVSGLSLAMMQHINMRTYENELRISVDLKGVK